MNFQNLRYIPFISCEICCIYIYHKIAVQMDSRKSVAMICCNTNRSTLLCCLFLSWCWLLLRTLSVQYLIPLLLMYVKTAGSDSNCLYVKTAGSDSNCVMMPPLFECLYGKEGADFWKSSSQAKRRNSLMCFIDNTNYYLINFIFSLSSLILLWLLPY